MLSRLLCSVDIHRAVTPGEWNLGYCFSECARCEASMVRSVLGGWKVPGSLRVVRTDQPSAYHDLDTYLRARELPRPASRARDLSADLPRAVAAVPQPQPEPQPRLHPTMPGGASPFDFSEFETDPPSAPPLKNVKAGVAFS